MQQLTSIRIINDLTASSSTYVITFIFIIIALFFVFFIFFRNFKEGKDTFEKIIALMPILFFLILLGSPLINSLLKYNATNYSIKNNTWYVETDTVQKSKSEYYRRSGGSSTSSEYFLYLSKYGKVSVDSNTYATLHKGDTVYIVIIQGRNGATYPTSQIYSTSKWSYPFANNHIKK